MTRTEYQDELARALGFMRATERDEVLADMNELYDELLDSGLDDAQVQDRMGTPKAVAHEYRLVEQLRRAERSPGAAAGFRLGYAALTGRLARGSAVPLFGLLWLALAIAAVGAAIVVIATLVFSVAAIAGFEPVVLTLAVPGISIAAGLLLGVAGAAAGAALLLAVRIWMRALSRRMRALLRPEDRPIPGRGADEPRRGRWFDSPRAAWIALAVALAASIGSATLYLTTSPPSYPLTVDRSEPLELAGAERIVIRAVRVDVRLEEGAPAWAHLGGELLRTFAQRVTLEAETAGGAVVLAAIHREGLSWGINAPPLLTVTLPRDLTVPVVIEAREGSVDVSGLARPARDLVTVRSAR